MGANYILRLDDVAANMRWDRMERIERVTGEFGIRPVVGVIPDNRDEQLLSLPACPGDFWARARGWAEHGWTLAMHGYQHLALTKDRGLLRIGAWSEFAGVAPAEQEHKLSRGRAILEAEGVGTDVFMAPCNSFDRATLAALPEAGFRRVSDGLALRPYRAHGLLFVPVLSGVVRTAPFGVWTTSIHLNTLEEAELDRLEDFLREHHRAFISFDDAEQLVSRSPINRPVGWALRRVSELARHRPRSGRAARQRDAPEVAR